MNPLMHGVNMKFIEVFIFLSFMFGVLFIILIINAKTRNFRIFVAVYPSGTQNVNKSLLWLALS